MGPHYFFGLSWSELAEIISIIVIMVTFFAYLMHVSVTKPMEWSNRALQKSIDQLTETVKSMQSGSEIVHKEHDRRLDQHDVRLAKHDEEIRTLFHQSGNRGH